MKPQKAKTTKRGRPPMDNEDKIGDLFRRLAGIANYWTLRGQPGVKHADALREAARLTAIETGMPMSATELKRILAQMQPKGWETVYTVTRRTIEEIKADLSRYPEGSMPRELAEKRVNALVLGWGRRATIQRQT